MNETSALSPELQARHAAAIEGMRELDAAGREAEAKKKQDASAALRPANLDRLFAHPAAVAAQLVPVQVTAGHIVTFERLNVDGTFTSPIARMLGELKKPEAERKDFTPTLEEMGETVFVICHLPAENRLALHAGREAFRDAALKATVDKLPPGLVEEMFYASLAWIVAELAAGYNRAAELSAH